MDYFIGIDVSKNTLDTTILRDGEILQERQIENSAKAVKAFSKELLATPGLSVDAITVCMEHTGIYSAIVLEVLWKMKIKICLEPALRIKQSQGMVRGKNDKIDARRIAQYAYKNRNELTPWRPQRPVIQQMQALLSLRERLLKAKVQLEVPLRESVGFMESSIVKKLNMRNRRTLKGIKDDLESIEKDLDELIKDDYSITKQVGLITSVPGVGRITAMNMIATTAEFTRIREAKKFACYAGVAPFEHASGSSIRGKTRVSKMANMTMKTLLHMAAMSAIQCSPEMKSFYQRKVSGGKNKMSVINAVRNKLISRVFACVNQDRHYQKNYEFALA
jgi:transposase